jgi:hypothetical protein
MFRIALKCTPVADVACTCCEALSTPTPCIGPERTRTGNLTGAVMLILSTLRLF